MHSYETLALLALAVSTASPALSAPVQESQQQARAIVDERATAAPGGVGSILKTIGTGLGLGALPVVLQDALGGNGTRRDLPARIIFDGLPVPDTSTDTTPANIVFDGLPVPLTQRAQVRSIITSLVNSVKSSDSLGKVLTNGVIGGVGSGVGAVGVNELLNNTRREPSPISASDLGGIGKTVAGTLASLAAASGVKELLNNTRREPSPLSEAILSRDDAESRDLIDALQLLGRHFDERAHVRGVVDSLVNTVKSSGSIGSVLGNGLLSGVASGIGALGANELLNRREPQDDLTAHGVESGISPDNLIRMFNLLGRHLEELD